MASARKRSETRSVGRPTTQPMTNAMSAATGISSSRPYGVRVVMFAAVNAPTAMKIAEPRDSWPATPTSTTSPAHTTA